MLVIQTKTPLEEISLLLHSQAQQSSLQMFKDLAREVFLSGFLECSGRGGEGVILMGDREGRLFVYICLV